MKFGKVERFTEDKQYKEKFTIAFQEKSRTFDFLKYEEFENEGYGFWSCIHSVNEPKWEIPEDVLIEFKETYEIV